MCGVQMGTWRSPGHFRKPLGFIPFLNHLDVPMRQRYEARVVKRWSITQGSITLAGKSLTPSPAAPFGLLLGLPRGVSQKLLEALELPRDHHIRGFQLLSSTLKCNKIGFLSFLVMDA